MHKQNHEMIRLITFMLIFICDGPPPSAENNSRLTAIHSSQYAFQLYKEIRNEDRPSTQDAAHLSTSIREHICENITRSQFFSRINLSSADPPRIFMNHSDPVHHRLSRHGYFPPRSWNNPRNVYRQRQFNRVYELFGLKEFLFMCFLQYANVIFPIYVSKEYNVGPYRRPYMPGRFIFWELFFKPAMRPYDPELEMILAEGPGVVCMSPHFNIELHYLQIRKYINRAYSNEIDPLCRLVSKRIRDPNNQHFRLCVAVFNSSHFEGQVLYPFAESDSCHLRKISFRTEEGLREANENRYYERLTRCSTNYLNETDEKRKTTLFISRAYGSNQILVYRQDASDGRVYLLKLVTNVSILDELSSFDLVEY